MPTKRRHNMRSTGVKRPGVKGHTTYAKPGRINWRRYFERKVIILALVAGVAYVIEYYYHIYAAGKGGELLVGTLIEHLFFEVPTVAEGV